MRSLDLVRLRGGGFELFRIPGLPHTEILVGLWHVDVLGEVGDLLGGRVGVHGERLVEGGPARLLHVQYLGPGTAVRGGGGSELKLEKPKKNVACGQTTPKSFRQGKKSGWQQTYLGKLAAAHFASTRGKKNKNEKAPPSLGGKGPVDTRWRIQKPSHLHALHFPDQPANKNTCSLIRKQNVIKILRPGLRPSI